ACTPARSCRWRRCTRARSHPRRGAPAARRRAPRRAPERRTRGARAWRGVSRSLLRQPPVRGGVDLVLVELLLPEGHQVRAPELLLREVDGEAGRELLPVPVVGLEELLVVVALLVPF